MVSERLMATTKNKDSLKKNLRREGRRRRNKLRDTAKASQRKR